jgi:hypothetical protein
VGGLLGPGGTSTTGPTTPPDPTLATGLLNPIGRPVNP